MSDLDSFFAKKNKKLIKGRKFTNPDDIAKRLEDKEKKLEKEINKGEPKKLLDEVLVSVINNQNAQSPKKEDEEEWQDFKADREHDLTNLKLAKLQIEDEEDGAHGSEDCVGNNKGDKSDGVWSKSAQATPVSEPEEVKPVKKAAVVAPAGPSVYMPPHLKHATALRSLRGGMNKKNKQAPDITNQMAFPSLGDAPPVADPLPWSMSKTRRNNDRYESVKRGATRGITLEHTAPRVDITNRFNALSDRS